MNRMVTARRYAIGCALAAAIVAGAVLAWTAYTIHDTGRAHRRAKGLR